MPALLLIPFICFGMEFNDLFHQALKVSPAIKAQQEKILASDQAIASEAVYKNPVLTIGVNDLPLNSDFLKRDLEPMQTQFIGITQELETFGKLDLKEAILKTDTLILEYELEDMKVDLYKKTALVVEKISVFDSLLELLEQKKANLEMLEDYYEKSISVADNFKVSVEVQKKIFNVQDKMLDIQDKITSFKNEFEYLTSQEYSVVTPANISAEFLQEDIKKSPKYKVFELKRKKLEFQSRLEQRQKYSNVKLNVSYNHRQNFDDYLSFSTSFALPVYGSEDAKVQRTKYFINENEQKEDDYLKNKAMLFNNMYKKTEYLKKRIKNIDSIIKRYKELNEYDRSNIKNQVTLEKNVQNENLLLDLKIEKLKYELDIRTAMLELFYITKEGI